MGGILEFLQRLPNELYVFVISILPIIELRGAIPVGAALGMPFYLNYLVAVLGNMLPIPFILLFIPKVLDFLARFKTFRPMVEWLRRKADKNKARVIKDDAVGDLASPDEETTEQGSPETEKTSSPKMSAGIFTALMIFVAIPLPGTGAWTGALVASLFGLPKRLSFLSIFLGVIIAGVIMCLASYGVLGFLSFLL